MPKTTMVGTSALPPKDQVKLDQEAQSIQYVRSISLTVVSVCCLTHQNLMTGPVISIPLPTIKDLLVQEQKVSRQHLDCTPQMSNSFLYFLFCSLLFFSALAVQKYIAFKNDLYLHACLKENIFSKKKLYKINDCPILIWMWIPFCCVKWRTG